VPGPTEDTHYELRVAAPPDLVLAALVAFGPERATIWRETSHPNVYRLHRLGEHEADVTEGVPFAWSRERYDWSRPGVITIAGTLMVIGGRWILPRQLSAGIDRYREASYHRA